MRTDMHSDYDEFYAYNNLSVHQSITKNVTEFIATIAMR